MGRGLIARLGALAIVFSQPLVAASPSIAIANQTGADIASMEIRRAGSGAWRNLGLSAPMGKTAAASINDPDCAFDIKVTLSNGEVVTFSGVNLCEVKLLTLRRSGKNAWVDYD